MAERRSSTHFANNMKRSTWLWLVPVVVVNACAPTTISGDDSGDAAADANTLDASSVDVTRSDASAGDSAADSAVSQPDASAEDDGSTSDSSAASDAASDDASSDSGASAEDAALDSSSDAGASEDSSADAASSDAASSEDAAVDSSSDAGASDAASDAATDGGSDGGGVVLSNYTVVQLPSAASCESPTAWTDTGFVDDDEASPVPMAMPFAFSLFGASAPYWSTSTNGVVELWPSSAGSPTDEYDNEELPSTVFSAGALAPFWDDLYLQSSTTIRYGVVGDTPTRRFIVDWDNIDTYSEEQSLHFQAKLFETSNVIEFHYCSMTTTGTSLRHTGSSATIGAQSLDGASSVQVSYDADNAVASGSLIRLVPR